MAGPEELYTTTMSKQFGYLATWFPGTQIGVGLVGTMQGKTFIPKSSIRTLGVSFTVTKDPSEDKILQFKSSKGIDIHSKLKGALSEIAPSIPKAKAGLAVTFGKETGVVFSARGIRSTRISDILKLEKAIWDLWDRFIWQKEWVIVTELLTAQRATILISEGGSSKVELLAKGSLQAGPIDVGDLSAGFTVASSHGLHTQIVGETGMTPLYRAIRIKDSFFRGPVMEGLRAPAPARPGQVPRRGLPKSDRELVEAGNLTETVA